MVLKRRIISTYCAQLWGWRFGVFKYFTNKIVFFHVHTLAEGEAKSKQCVCQHRHKKEEWYKEKDQSVVCQWKDDASTISFLQETNQISFSVTLDQRCKYGTGR